jgi:hypothetical protein
MADRLAIPLRARFTLRQHPSGGALAGVAEEWRERMPSAGRLGLMVNAARARLAIVGTRAALATFHFKT